MITKNTEQRILERMKNLIKEASELHCNNPDYAEAFGMAMTLYMSNGGDYPPGSDSYFHEMVSEEIKRRDSLRELSESVIIS